MENTEKRKKNRFGLLGKDIAYSFSQTYFNKKFEQLKLSEFSYENFDLKRIEDFQTLEPLSLRGFNVTIPYKEAIIPYLSRIDAVAAEIGAVNTVKIDGDSLVGYNTDAYGFEQAICPYLAPHHQRALVLGTGGASKAITYVLAKKNISYTMVSRTPTANQLAYDDLNAAVLQHYQVIINCTPVGTFPQVDRKPALAYHALNADYLLFDLIYNPSRTAFLTAGELQGATAVNGAMMLTYQAEKAWEIWETI